MIEIGFAIIFGFMVTATTCGLIADWSRYDRLLIRALVYLILLSLLIALYSGGVPTDVRYHARYLIFGSLFDQTLWFLLGAVFALSIQLFAEGFIHHLWIKLHPQSAPTPDVRMGQRAQIAGFRRETPPATLVGTSTKYLTSELDLYTDTLIRLCYSVFEDRGALTLSRLEGELRLGTGQRQKAFHKIVAGSRGRPNVKRISHRYWRSVNGSSRMSQTLFGDLCKLAHVTNNRDPATIERLTTVGIALGLSNEEMGRAIRGSL